MIEVTEQASQNNGKRIVTVFSDGSKMYQHSDATYPTEYRSKPNSYGGRRALHPARDTKKCALMDKLAAAGIK